VPTAEEIKDSQRTTWARLSGSWDKWDAAIMQQLAPVGEAMIGRLAVAPDQQHLDVAAGTGEPGLTIAGLAPNGRVVLCDLSTEMLEVAARRAAARGLTNVVTRVCSADELPFDSATFDSVSVRFGYMFFPDLARATSEFVRVLRPGGRLCASVWVEPARNPWTSIVVQALASEVEVPPPDLSGPHMYRCATKGCVGELYEDAGLTEVAEWDVGVELVAESAERYWEMTSEHVSIASAVLQRVDDAAKERIRAHAVASASAYERDGAVRVPGLARCIVGRKV
jgi:SAM-dependent methyltransferase